MFAKSANLQIAKNVFSIKATTKTLNVIYAMKDIIKIQQENAKYAIRFLFMAVIVKFAQKMILNIILAIAMMDLLKLEIQLVFNVRMDAQNENMIY